MDMSSHLNVALVLTFTTLAHPLLAHAQARQQVIYASVVDRDGTPITSLGRSDFVVREDRVAREVLAAVPATDPLRIALLVDTSQAMEPHINNVRAALKAFINGMQGRHEIALFGFGERPTLLADYTRDPARLEKAVGRVFSHTATGAYLLDAITEVSRGLQTRENARSVIVVISGEGPEFSNRYHAAVVDALRDADATLHSFVMARRRIRVTDEGAREREFAIAKGTHLTGGRRENLLTSMALTERLQSLAAELNNQYRIVYARPDSLIGPEKVHVTIDRPDLIVRAARVARGDRTTE
jgi:Ca-activated chloride channel family protein